MTAKPKKFPLNFDAPTWCIEEAVPWIFFGDGCEEPTWAQATKLAVGYVVGEVDDGRLRRESSAALATLQKHLRTLGVLSRSTKFPPLIWCRMAIQFWLEKGGRQQKFITAMTRWVKDKNKGGVAAVSYKNDDHPSDGEIALEVFLFASIDVSALVKNEWIYRRVNGKAATKSKANATGKRSAESQVGSNLLAAVKAAVQNLKSGKQGRKLFLRTPAPGNEKFRFIGLREELCKEIYAISTDISGKRLLKNGQYQKAYSESSVMKAISEVAICRRSWLVSDRK